MISGGIGMSNENDPILHLDPREPGYVVDEDEILSDIGPPAPGEGDDLPDPEAEMEC
jgi:hypothetical protein